MATTAHQTQRPPGRARRLRRRRGGAAASFVLLAAGGVFVLLPLFWLLSTAFKTANDAFALPPRYFAGPRSATSARSSAARSVITC